MVDDIEAPISLAEKRGIQQMLKRKQDAFMLEGDELGKTNQMQHEIQTNTKVAIMQPARRFPFHQ